MIYPAPAAESPWQIIRSHKAQAAAAVAGGVIAGICAKYIAAGLLILWIAAGGQ
jgi:hypothetical protein